jgi:hypothetical protein
MSQAGVAGSTIQKLQEAQPKDAGFPHRNTSNPPFNGGLEEFKPLFLTQALEDVRRDSHDTFYRAVKNRTSKSLNPTT